MDFVKDGCSNLAQLKKMEKRGRTKYVLKGKNGFDLPLIAVA